MFNENFYPTPKWLANKMLDKLVMYTGMEFLEPSAGKGDIADIILQRLKGNNLQDDVYKSKIDTIELSDDLQATLKGKGYRVVHDDFLTYDTRKKYHAIVMNPPFDNGVKHLLKALEIQKRGGQIVCLLNAETIKNPYSNDRDKLIRLLDEYDAEVEYIENAFTSAERTTNVEVALIYVNIENNNRDSLLFDTLKNEKELEGYKFTDKNQIITSDPIEATIQQYKLEIDAGLKLIYNYFDLIPLIQNQLDEDKPQFSLLRLSIYNDRYITETNSSIINEYIEGIRYKYWSALINLDKFSQLLTSELRDEMRAKLSELKHYEFSRYNIQEVIKNIKLNMNDSIVTTIMKLFDDLTYRYTYDNFSSNIHLYDGWKTNQGYKINDKKVIIPLSGYSSWNNYSGIYFSNGSVEEKIRDMQKSLEYLDGGKTRGYDNIREILSEAEKENNDFVEFKYFKIKFYKKGTAHVHWKDKELIKKFNIFAGKEKGWLPSSYARVNYEDMTSEEKQVVDSFEGRRSYSKTLENREYHLELPNIDNIMLM